ATIRGTSNSTREPGLNGEIFFEGGKVYRQVKAGPALEDGDVVVHDLTADDGYTVTTTTTANVLHGAGVITETIDSGNYGRMLVHGIHEAVKLDGSGTNIAAGDAIGTIATAKKGGKTTTANAAIGIALDAVTTDTTGQVFVKAL